MSKIQAQLGFCYRSMSQTHGSNLGRWQAFRASCVAITIFLILLPSKHAEHYLQRKATEAGKKALYPDVYEDCYPKMRNGSKVPGWFMVSAHFTRMWEILHPENILLTVSLGFSFYYASRCMPNFCLFMTYAIF